MKDRIACLDNLKTAIIVLTVVFHCAMCYMAYVPEWWYVVDDKAALSFTWFVVWADNFIMPIMFFVSGYFGLKSLRRQNPADFWHKKFFRLGLPWLFGMIFFVPHIIWIWFFSRNIPITLSNVIFKQYFGPFYQQSLYWYLSALLALYLLLFCAAKIWPSWREDPAITPNNKLKPRCFFLYIISSAIPMAAINLACPDGFWLNVCYLLMLQITRVPLYIVSFFFGAYCERNNWLGECGGGRTVFDDKIWGVIFLIASLVFVYFRMNYAIDTPPMIIFNAFFHCSFCLVSLLAAVSVFKNFFNGTTPLVRELSSLSYPLYYIHQTIVQTVVLYVRPLAADVYVKYAVSSVISLFLCYFICKYILKKLPCFR